MYSPAMRHTNALISSRKHLHDCQKRILQSASKDSIKKQSTANEANTLTSKNEPPIQVVWKQVKPAQVMLVTNS